MKNQRLYFVALVIGVLLNISIFAQEEEKEEAYQFTMVKEVPTTSVKDQYRSGTCWSFSGLAFIESELLRIGKGEYDLSAMWVVRKSYEDQARKYVRMHGSLNFSAGGAFVDVLNVIKNHGIVPTEVYKGLNYGEDKHVHGELDNILKSYVDAVLKNGNKKLSPVWLDAYKAVLDV